MAKSYQRVYFPERPGYVIVDKDTGETFAPDGPSRESVAADERRRASRSRYRHGVYRSFGSSFGDVLLSVFAIFLVFAVIAGTAPGLYFSPSAYLDNVSELAENIPDLRFTFGGWVDIIYDIFTGNVFGAVTSLWSNIKSVVLFPIQIIKVLLPFDSYVSTSSYQQVFNW